MPVYERQLRCALCSRHRCLPADFGSIAWGWRCPVFGKLVLTRGQFSVRAHRVGKKGARLSKNGLQPASRARRGSRGRLCYHTHTPCVFLIWVATGQIVRMDVLRSSSMSYLKGERK